MADATLDSVDFRNAMARFASGVTIVTTLDQDGRSQGFTATAFSSLSLDPPLVLVCLDKHATCYQAFMDAGEMAISFLAADQGDLAWHFARRQEDKFDGVSVLTGEATGMPLIPGAAVHLECRIYDRLAGGDHTIILGEVVRARSEDRDPLVHYNRQMGRFIAL